MTAEAKTKSGCSTSTIGERVLFEIPRAQLNKDELLVTEIAKTTLGAGYGGQAVEQPRVALGACATTACICAASRTKPSRDPSTPEYRAAENANVPSDHRRSSTSKRTVPTVPS